MGVCPWEHMQGWELPPLVLALLFESLLGSETPALRQCWNCSCTSPDLPNLWLFGRCFNPRLSQSKLHQHPINPIICGQGPFLVEEQP